MGTLTNETNGHIDNDISTSSSTGSKTSSAEVVARAYIGDIVVERIVEEYGVLRHDSDAPSNTVKIERANVLSVDENRALPRVIESVQQSSDGTLATAARSYEGDARSWTNGE